MNLSYCGALSCLGRGVHAPAAPAGQELGRSAQQELSAAQAQLGTAQHELGEAAAVTFVLGHCQPRQQQHQQHQHQQPDRLPGMLPPMGMCLFTSPLEPAPHPQRLQELPTCAQGSRPGSSSQPWTRPRSGPARGSRRHGGGKLATSLSRSVAGQAGGIGVADATDLPAVAAEEQAEPENWS